VSVKQAAELAKRFGSKELTEKNSRIKLAKGDLWDWFDKGHRVVVTTNIGWHPSTGRNNMGAGMALQAALRFPGLERDLAGGAGPRVKAEDRAGYRTVFPEGLDVWYGSLCEQLGDETPVVAYPAERRLILFPVKPLLDPENPERSWDQEASYTLIAKSLAQLRTFEGRIALSYPGAGNGHLDEKKVALIVENILGQDPNPERFTLVTFKPKQTGLELRKLGGESTPLDDLFLDTRYAPR
jgi:hypothetical protein